MKVFSATKAKDREELGEAVTRWLQANSDLEIVDPHHHLWIRDGNTYLLPELLADGTIRVDMGVPLLDPEAVPTTLAAQIDASLGGKTASA